MKLIRSIFPILIAVLISTETYSQHVYAVAVSSTGLLTGKYKVTTDSENSILDTITLDEAKSIFAINAVNFGRDKGISKVRVAEYQIKIIENGDTTKIKGKSDMLSRQMKERLNKINSGAIIYFEGIKVEFATGEGRAVILLAFIAI